MEKQDHIAQMKEMSAEFRRLAQEFNGKADKMDAAIREAESQAFRHSLDRILAAIADNDSLNGREVIFLVNRSAEMGAGYQSFFGQAATAASTLNSAARGVVDVPVSASAYGSGAPVRLKLDHVESLGAVINGTPASGALDLLPALKEMLAANTPDKTGGKPRHYVVIAPDRMTGGLDDAVGILEAAMKMNPGMTVDFLRCGPAAGGGLEDVMRLVSPVSPVQTPAIHAVETPACMAETISAVLKQRVASMPVPNPAPDGGAAQQPSPGAKPGTP